MPAERKIKGTFFEGVKFKLKKRKIETRGREERERMREREKILAVKYFFSPLKIFLLRKTCFYGIIPTSTTLYPPTC